MTTTPTTARRWLRDDVGQRDWTELVKGVAILVVLVYHCMLFLRAIEVEGGGMGRVKLALELFPMPAFFLIAGIFHQRVREWTLADTWRRRLVIYLYLYVLWSAIRFAFYLALPNVRSEAAGSADASDPLTLLVILVWPTSSYWFIYALFLFTAVLWLTRRLPIWVPLTGSLVISLVFSSGLFTARNVGWDRIGEYLVFFIAGALLATPIQRRLAQIRWWWVPVAIAAYVGICALMVFVSGTTRIPGVAFLGQVAALATAITLAWYLVRLKPLWFLSWIGERSFQIYLVHIFVIAALTSIVRTVPGLGGLGSGFVVLGLMAVLVLVISILAGRLLSRVSWLFVPPRVLRRRPRRASQNATTP